MTTKPATSVRYSTLYSILEIFMSTNQLHLILTNDIIEHYESIIDVLKAAIPTKHPPMLKLATDDVRLNSCIIYERVWSNKIVLNPVHHYYIDK